MLTHCKSLVRIDPSIKLLKELKYLSLQYCSKLENVPTEMAHLEALVELDATKSGIRKISIFTESSIKMEKLQLLDLSSCEQLTEISSFSSFPNLEKLVLTHCKSLVRIDPSIKLLRKLKYLSLQYCSKLENVPTDMAHLEALVELDATKSGLREISIFTESSIKMEKLQLIDLSSCEQLTEISSFSSFPNLEKLVLTNCKSLVRINPSIKLLKELKYLSLKFCSKLENVPTELAHLEALVELDATNSGLREISILTESSIKMVRLKVLDLSHCEQLRAISSFALFPNLERLILEHCTSLVSIDESIELLKILKYLNLKYCSKLENLPDQLARLETLVELNVSYSGVRTIPLSPRMTKLGALDASSCRCLKSLPADMSTLSHLQKLSLKECWDLHNLPELSPSLTNLQVGAPSVRTLWNLQDLVNLKELQLHGDYGKPQQNLDEQATAKFTQLEKLVLIRVSFCSLPEEIASSPRLKKIRIDSSDGLQWLPPLSSKLLSLTLKGCPLLKRLPNLLNLTKLTELSISECPVLREIEGLSDLTSLQDLCISGCHSSVIDGVSSASSVRKLSIGGCDMEALPDLSDLRKLRRLELSGYRKLVDFQGIGSLSKLEAITFSNCTSLQRIPGIANLESLVELRVADCPEIEHLPLSKLLRLKELTLYECKKLCALEGLQELNSLERLKVESCNSIEEPLHLPPRLVSMTVKGCEKWPDRYDPPSPE